MKITIFGEKQHKNNVFNMPNSAVRQNHGRFVNIKPAYQTVAITSTFRLKTKRNN